MNYRIVITSITFLIILSGTYLAVRWAKGYRLNIQDQAVVSSGLLVANSDPAGASVYIDGKLTTATNDTIHLYPGNHMIKMEKDGYAPWEKLLKVEEELVTQANAILFPKVPNLSSLTVNGATGVKPSPNGQKIAYQIATESAVTKQGIWVLNLNGGFLSGTDSQMIINDTEVKKFSKAKLFWSPNSTQILAYFSDNESYLLNATHLNDSTQILNYSFQVEATISDWEQQIWLDGQKRMAKLPIKMQQYATESATLTYFSPNEEKFLYVATQEAKLADHLIPEIPAINSTPQDRDLKIGSVYVYDIKEDTNYELIKELFKNTEVQKIAQDFNIANQQTEKNNKLGKSFPSPTVNKNTKLGKLETKPITNPTLLEQRLISLQMHYSPIYTECPLQWFPSSDHLINHQNKRLAIMEYDGSNETVVYSGPFAQDFVYPWPTGGKLIILTSLTSDINVVKNIYTVSLE